MKFRHLIKLLFAAVLSGSLFLQCPPEIPDEIPPVVNIIHPIDGQAVSGTVLVSVGASDETELRDVSLFIDGSIVLSSPGPLLQYNWDTEPIADNRNHSLYATATDGNNNNGFSGSVVVRVVSGANPDTLPPVITILNPITGSTVSDTVNVVPQVEDETGIDRVEYYVNGNLVHTANQEPYNFQWNVNTLQNGSTANLFARAYDLNQNNSVSNTVTVTVQNTDTTPPTVLILYPSTGDIFLEGQVVSISVQAEDDAGIHRVEFFIDGELIFTDTTSGYQYDWNTTGYGDNGSHTIYVKAYDFANNNNAQLITVTVQNSDEIPPTVLILYPSDGSTFFEGQIVPISVQADDNIGVKQVDFYIDGVLQFSDSTADYLYNWNTTGYGDNGPHSIYVKAIDFANNNNSQLISVTVAAVPPDTTAPVITLIHPQSGSTVSDTVKVVPEISDASPIDRVEYFVDGNIDFTATQAPFEYDWDVTGFSNGSTHNIFARAYDIYANGGVSNVLSVTIQNTDIIPPTVLILYPATGSIFTIGTVVTISVDASDNVGIDRVEFYVDGELLSTDTTPPYRYNWDSTGYSSGTHTIYVKAFDLAGNNNSQLITVTLNP